MPAYPQNAGLSTGGFQVPNNPAALSMQAQQRASAAGPRGAGLNAMLRGPQPQMQQQQQFLPQWMQPGQMPGSSPIQQQNFNVRTSITPSNIYSNNLTQRTLNQNRAQGVVQGNANWLEKQFLNPGISASAGTRAQAMPMVAQARAGNAASGAQIPFQDAQANAANRLQGETGRDAEALGWANLMGGTQQAFGQDQISRQLSGMSLLRQILGM